MAYAATQFVPLQKAVAMVDPPPVNVAFHVGLEASETVARPPL
jgi:hypothetical protein